MAQPLALEKVKELIPHREPMLLITEVTDWEPNKWLEARCHLPENSPLFAGHFPGNPVLPGMLNYEAIAQAAALLVSLSRGLNAENATYLFGGLENGKFFSLVKPGETLRVRAEYVRDRLNVFRFHGKSWVAEKPVAEATFTAKLIVKQGPQQ